jgi:hypothetical protein
MWRCRTPIKAAPKLTPKQEAFARAYRAFRRIIVERLQRFALLLERARSTHCNNYQIPRSLTGARLRLLALAPRRLPRLAALHPADSEEPGLLT